MHVSKNCYQQNASGQDDHKFLISSHKHHPFLQNSERVGARPPAARINILFCTAPAVTGAKLLQLLISNSSSAVFGLLCGKTFIFQLLNQPIARKGREV